MNIWVLLVVVLCLTALLFMIVRARCVVAQDLDDDSTGDANAGVCASVGVAACVCNVGVAVNQIKI